MTNDIESTYVDIAVELGRLMREGGLTDIKSHPDCVRATIASPHDRNNAGLADAVLDYRFERQGAHERVIGSRILYVFPALVDEILQFPLSDACVDALGRCRETEQGIASYLDTLGARVPREAYGKDTIGAWQLR